MNLWTNFGLKFTLFYKGKMAKISPKINNIEMWPKSPQKVITSQNKSHWGHIWGIFEYKSGLRILIWPLEVPFFCQKCQSLGGGKISTYFSLGMYMRFSGLANDSDSQRVTWTTFAILVFNDHILSNYSLWKMVPPEKGLRMACFCLVVSPRISIWRENITHSVSPFST